MDERQVKYIGVAIGAIGVIAAILYYRNQATMQADAAAQGSGTAFPYFQTAAIPSSNASTNAGTGISSGSGGSSPLDLNALVSANMALQAHTVDTNAAITQQQNWIDLLSGAIGKQLGQTSGTYLTQGQIFQTSGGFGVAVQSTPIGGLPYGGLWSTSGGYNNFGALNPSPYGGGPATPTNSTGGAAGSPPSTIIPAPVSSSPLIESPQFSWG